MAFTAITPVNPGDPVSATDFNTAIGDLNDHESRISSVEVLGSRVSVFEFPVMNASSSNTMTGLVYFRAPTDFILIEAKLAAYEIGGRTGILEIDIKKTASLDPTGAVSVFTTKPSINYSTASDYDESSNAVISPINGSILEGEYLRLDLTSMPSPLVGKFYLAVYGEV